MARTAKNKTAQAGAAQSESLDFDGCLSAAAGEEKNSVSFEEALAKLEIIVKDLEAGELPLEDSLTKFAEGISLSKICLNKLNAAQVKIDKILQEENGELVLRPFEPLEGSVE